MATAIGRAAASVSLASKQSRSFSIHNNSKDFWWRRERDSNPRYTFWAYAPLAGECLRPLGHLSDQARDCTFQHPASSNQFLCEIRGLQIAHAKSRLTLPALSGVALNRTKHSLLCQLGRLFELE